MDQQSAQNRRARLVPDDIAAKINEIGKNFEESVVGKCRDIYVPIHEKIPNDGVAITKDIPYGPDPERHLLDIHVPESKPAGTMPTVIFFHGGGFIRGHKNAEGETIYGNVATYFARHGIIGINGTYRLAPDIKWPDGGRDVGNSLAWAREHIAEYGGDPDKIFLMGHSAGASHVATYAFRSMLHPTGGSGIAGAILCSGVYGIERGGAAPTRAAYYGEDESKYDEMEVLGNVDKPDFPVFVTVAENDPAMFEKVAFSLMGELVTKHGVSPRFKQVLGHNHISETYHIGTSDETLGPDLVDFVLGGR